MSNTFLGVHAALLLGVDLAWISAPNRSTNTVSITIVTTALEGREGEGMAKQNWTDSSSDLQLPPPWAAVSERRGADRQTGGGDSPKRCPRVFSHSPP